MISGNITIDNTTDDTTDVHTIIKHVMVDSSAQTSDCLFDKKTIDRSIELLIA